MSSISKIMVLISWYCPSRWHMLKLALGIWMGQVVSQVDEFYVYLIETHQWKIVHSLQPFAGSRTDEVQSILCSFRILSRVKKLCSHRYNQPAGHWFSSLKNKQNKKSNGKNPHNWFLLLGLPCFSASRMKFASNLHVPLTLNDRFCFLSLRPTPRRARAFQGSGDLHMYVSINII